MHVPGPQQRGMIWRSSSQRVLILQLSAQKGCSELQLVAKHCARVPSQRLSGHPTEDMGTGVPSNTVWSQLWDPRRGI